MYPQERKKIFCGSWNAISPETAQLFHEITRVLHLCCFFRIVLFTLATDQ